jgi:uncharacterized protein
VTPSETIDATRSLLLVDLSIRADVYNGLRAVLAKRPEDYDKFEQLFRQFWQGLLSTGSIANSKAIAKETRPNRREKISKNTAITSTSREGRKDLLQVLASMNESTSKAKEILALYSPVDRRGKKMFESLESEDRARMKRGLRTFARRMATRPGRRSIYSVQVDRLDFKRTIRSNLKSGGEFTGFSFKSRKITKSRLIFVCDVSGSMDSWSTKLLKVIYHACNTIRGASVYVFSTDIVPVNKLMQGRSLEEASRLVSEDVDIWSSGTRIGSALGALLARHAGMLRPTTVLVIISDGWEVGDLDLLKSNMRELKRRTAGIVWLNPQADDPKFQPLAAGMKAALPFVDFFGGLDVIIDRKTLENVLGKSIHAMR